MKKITVNYLNEVCGSYINKPIEKIIYKDESISILKGGYLGIVDFKVCICEENSLNTIELYKVKEIIFK